MDTLLQDLRYAARKLIHAPGFTFVAVATLTLAIGAATAVFSIVNGVLLKPFPFDQPDRVAFIASISRGEAIPLSPLDFIDLRKQSTSFVDMAAYDRGTLNVTSTGAEPARLQAARVGASFFAVLGVDAQRGRMFLPGEDAAKASRVVVLTDHLWRNLYGADPRLIGQSIRLDGDLYTVVGVTPASLNFPSAADLFVPLVYQPFQLNPAERGAHSHFVIGRLKDGITMQAASTELNGIAARLAIQYPETNANFGAEAKLLSETIIGKAGGPLYSMLGAVALVLLIACANVANLQLVRAAGRETEMAVRSALGAARLRIVRQLVTESLLLSLAGAVLGAGLASWLVAGVVAYGPEGVPRLQEVAVDTTVLAFALGLGLLTAIVFGLAPAVHAARTDIAQMVRDNARGSSKTTAQRTRGMLVVAEIALAIVLLVGAGLLIRSFVRLINVDPGFKPERVIAFNLSLPDAKYPREKNVRAVVAELTTKLKQMPGTRAVGVTFGRPLDNTGMMFTVFEVDGWPPSTPNARRETEVHMTSPGYFDAMGIRLVRGRLYTADEDRPGVPPVVVVTQEFARKHFPHDDPIGKYVRFGIEHDTASTGDKAFDVPLQGRIVGIVADVKQHDLTRKASPTAYAPFNTFAIGFFSVLVRTDADARAAMGGIRRAVREIDGDLPIYGMSNMEQAIVESVAQPRFYMLLLGGFAAIALLLAALGIYGVISYTVSQRLRELGIRVALGATRERIVRLVIGQGAVMTAIGIVVGIGVSFAATRVVASLLFDVGRFDPVTLVVAPLTLLAAALLGCWVPARRAANVDPAVAMRSD